MWKRIAAGLIALALVLWSPFIHPAHATPAQDYALDEAMRSVGIVLWWPQARYNAAAVCSNVWAGRHPQYVASMVASNNPSWYYEQAEAFVAAAILIYCPPVDTASSTVLR